MSRLENFHRWQGLIKEWQSSHTSLLSFCLEREINYDTAKRWKRRFGAAPQPPQPIENLEFSEIKLCNAQPSSIVLLFKNAKIRLEPDFDDDALGRVLRILEAL
jgi:hypothetical protein